MVWKQPQLTDPPMSSPEIGTLNRRLLKVYPQNSRANEEGVQLHNVFDAATDRALRNIQSYLDGKFVAQLGAKFVNSEPGVATYDTKVALGVLVKAPPPPPKPKARHAWLVFRGTGGIIGADYVSRVCQNGGELVEEINPDFPASMGGLPPGAPGTPSARIAIHTGFESGCRWIESNSRTFGLGGYSLGEIVVAMLLDALFTPGGRLYEHRHRYVASFHIGPPARPLGGGYFGGMPAPGVGISSWRLPNAVLAEVGAKACYLCHPDDMYGSIPVPIPGGTGDIMETVFDMITDAGMSDFLGTIQRMIPHLLEIVSDAGILPGFGGGVGAPAAGGGDLLGGILGGGGAGGLLGGGAGGAGALLGSLGGLTTMGGAAMLGGPLALVPFILPQLIAALPGLIAGIGNPSAGNLTGPAAAAQAAIIGMKFLMTGTAPHIQYHTREVWPGQTYLGLAIQHVRHWAGVTPVRI